MIKHREAFVFLPKNDKIRAIEVECCIKHNFRTVRQYLLNIYIIYIYVIIDM
jgi:hypothetical protein